MVPHIQCERQWRFLAQSLYICNLVVEDFSFKQDVVSSSGFTQDLMRCLASLTSVELKKSRKPFENAYLTFCTYRPSQFDCFWTLVIFQFLSSVLCCKNLCTFTHCHACPQFYAHRLFSMWVRILFSKLLSLLDCNVPPTETQM